MPWTAEADVPFTPAGVLLFSPIIGREVYVNVSSPPPLPGDANFWKYNIGTNQWTQLADIPYNNVNILNGRQLTYRNGRLYCVTEGAVAEPLGLRISWYDIATDTWASSSQIGGGYRNIRGFCFADDDTIWAWCKRSGVNQVKCCRYVISTDTFTEFVNNLAVASVSSRCAAINAAGTIVYGASIGPAAGHYSTYTIAGDAYATFGPHGTINYSWIADPLRLWFFSITPPITDYAYGYLDIATLTYHDDYWPGNPDRVAAFGRGGVEGLNAIIDQSRLVNPMIYSNGGILPTAQTNPATEIK